MIALRIFLTLIVVFSVDLLLMKMFEYELKNWQEKTLISIFLISAVGIIISSLFAIWTF